MTEFPLLNKRVAIAGGRRFTDIERIIKKLGGEALKRPMMSSSPNDSDDVANAIRMLVQQKTDWMILVTGVGTNALLNKALELDEDVKSILQKARIAARGYKTLKVLKDLGLEADIKDCNGTLDSLKKQLEPFDFKGKQVTIQLHGERMPELSQWLINQGANVLEVPLYFYDAPPIEDSQKLLYETLSGKLEAIAFTSNTQVKFFFQAAQELNALPYLKEALNTKVITLSVGSMTSQALSEQGIKRIVAPEHERMGAMIMALADYFRDKEKRTKNEERQTSFPVLLTDLQRVVVVGGGNVAERKVKALVEANIKPTLISPDITKELDELKQASKIKHFSKKFEPADLKDAQLVIAASNDSSLNAAIAIQAKQVGSLVNLVDKPELGDFTTLGTIRRGSLCIALSTNGKSPSLNRYLKETLEQQFSEPYAALLDALERHRQALLSLSLEQRTDLLDVLAQKDNLEDLSQKPNFHDHLEQFIEDYIAQYCSC